LARILIADDEPHILLGVEYLLQQRGHEVHKASDGTEARMQLQSLHPDLAILDVMMPPSGVDEGLLLCQWIKENESTRNIPVIVLTVKAQESDRQKAQECGVDAYLTKPIDREALFQTIDRLVIRSTH
jgi:CheY-like chemotaxis protein